VENCGGRGSGGGSSTPTCVPTSRWIWSSCGGRPTSPPLDGRSCGSPTLKCRGGRAGWRGRCGGCVDPR